MNIEQLQRSLKRNKEQIASDRPTKKRKNRNELKLLDLPPEIITRIVYKIAPDSLPTALRVCKLFLQIGNQDKIRYRYISTLFKWADKEGFKTALEQKGPYVKSLRISERHGLRFVLDVILKNCPNLRTLINKSSNAITTPFPRLEHITVTLAALNAGQPLHNVRSLRVIKSAYEACSIQLDQKLMSNLVRLHWGPSYSLPIGFALLTNLRYLSLPHIQQLSKNDLDAISLLCKHLKSLALKLPPTETSLVMSLEDITGPQLYELRLCNVPLTEKSALSLPRSFPNLQILDLTKTIHHPPIDSINSWRLYSLTWIDLNLTDEFAKVKLPHLEHLSVKKNSAVSMKAFKNLVKRFPRLTYFAASGCHKLGPDLLDELLPFKGLKELHLTRTAITSFSIKQYFQRGGGARLRVFSASSISGDCDDACLKEIFSPVLRELRVSAASSVSTAGMLGLRRMQLLKKLYLGTRPILKQVQLQFEETGIQLLQEDPDEY
jgi:hypothetical protein